MRDGGFKIVLVEWKARRLSELVERELEVPPEPTMIIATGATKMVNLSNSI